MSIFSKIKQSRKAAKDHKAQAEDKQKQEVAEQKVPYRHVPTHAAVDALSGAPSSWKHEDRSKIREYHSRRSQMAISRTGSTISQASYLHSSSRSSVLPRDASYSSFSPVKNDQSGSTQYLNEPRDKRSKPSRNQSFQSSRIRPSPLSSAVHSEGSPSVDSSGNSTASSSDSLPELASKASIRPQPSMLAQNDIFQRLHTSTTRKVGEAPRYDSPSMKLSATTTIIDVTDELKPNNLKKQKPSTMGKQTAISVV